MRTFATVCCLIAVVLGAAAIVLHGSPESSIIFYVSSIWTLGSIVLSGAYKREYWKKYDMTLSEAIKEDAAGRWPAPNPLGRIAMTGAIVLGVISAYLDYFR